MSPWVLFSIHIQRFWPIPVSLLTYTQQSSVNGGGVKNQRGEALKNKMGLILVAGACSLLKHIFNQILKPFWMKMVILDEEF
jgi:hypothetical protein